MYAGFPYNFQFIQDLPNPFVLVPPRPCTCMYLRSKLGTSEGTGVCGSLPYIPSVRSSTTIVTAIAPLPCWPTERPKTGFNSFYPLLVGKPRWVLLKMITPMGIWTRPDEEVWYRPAFPVTFFFFLKIQNLPKLSTSPFTSYLPQRRVVICFSSLELCWSFHSFLVSNLLRLLSLRCHLYSA